MPNRVVREGILDSDKVNKLSWGAEVFFRRLMSVVDDFGRYDARTSLMKSRLYPIEKDKKVNIKDVEGWLRDCVKGGLIMLYEVSGKWYLEILEFNQTVRIKKSKFPAPDFRCEQMRADARIRMSESNPIQTETETESETIENKNHLFTYSVFYDFEKFNEEMLKHEKYGPFDFNYYHESAKNWSAQGKMKKDWIATVKNWMLRDLREGKPKLKNEFQQKFNKQNGNATGKKVGHSMEDLVQEIHRQSAA